MAKGKSKAGRSPASESISIRRIDNGYVISRSSMQGDSWKCSETYSKDKPVVEVPAAKRPAGRVAVNPLLSAGKLIGKD